MDNPENTEGAINSGQSKDTGYIGYTRRRKTKQKYKTTCVGHHYTQTSRNNVNKISAPGGKYEHNIVFIRILYLIKVLYDRLFIIGVTT